MTKTIDARGLSCPQPVLMILNEMSGLEAGEIVILVDTDTSKENVSRAAGSRGWRVEDIAPDGDGYRITVARQ